MRSLLVLKTQVNWDKCIHNGEDLVHLPTDNASFNQVFWVDLRRWTSIFPLPTRWEKDPIQRWGFCGQRVVGRRAVMTMSVSKTCWLHEEKPTVPDSRTIILPFWLEDGSGYFRVRTNGETEHARRAFWLCPSICDRRLPVSLVQCRWV